MNIKRYKHQFIEIWRPVVGYEGLYMVSNLGRVKSINYRRTGQEGILQPYDEGHGYRMVDLYKDNIRQKYRVHRLVAMAFIPNPLNKREVDHINFVRDDNRVSNLRWATSKENQHYKMVHMTSQEMDLIPI